MLGQKYTEQKIYWIESEDSIPSDSSTSIQSHQTVSICDVSYDKFSDKMN